MRKRNGSLGSVIRGSVITLLSMAIVLGSSITAFADLTVESGYDTLANTTFGEALAASRQGEYYSTQYSEDVLACPVYYLTADSTFIMPVDGSYNVCVDPWDFPTSVSELESGSYPGKTAKQGEVCRFFDEQIATQGLHTGGEQIDPYEVTYALYIYQGEWNNNVYMRLKLIDSQTAQNLASSTISQEVSGVSQDASTWAQDSKGWWIQNADGSYLTNAWYLNTDGKWYYMGADGYMLTNTTTPDGYKVGADGAWLQ